MSAEKNLGCRQRILDSKETKMMEKKSFSENRTRVGHWVTRACPTFFSFLTSSTFITLLNMLFPFFVSHPSLFPFICKKLINMQRTEEWPFNASSTREFPWVVSCIELEKTVSRSWRLKERRSSLPCHLSLHFEEKGCCIFVVNFWTKKTDAVQDKQRRRDDDKHERWANVWKEQTRRRKQPLRHTMTKNWHQTQKDQEDFEFLFQENEIDDKLERRHHLLQKSNYRLGNLRRQWKGSLI